MSTCKGQINAIFKLCRFDFMCWQPISAIIITIINLIFSFLLKPYYQESGVMN